MSQSNEIKFDIVISNYTWTSDNPDAKLALEMQALGGGLEQGSNGNDLEFDGAYLNFVDSAVGSSGNIDVSMSVGNSNSFSFIYDNFW